MTIIRRYGDTDFVTGLRAIAATMVVTIHTGAFVDFGTIGGNITASGKYGVQMFFVISGFTIAATFASSGGYRPYIVRRLFRIAPLYWLICALMAILLHAAILPPTYWMQRFEVDVDFYNVAMHFFFLSFLDYRIAASFIGPEWTIPIEIFWYIVLPLLIVRCSTPRNYLVALAGLLVLAGLTRAAAGLAGHSVIAHWFPTTYGAYFLIGVYCHSLRQEGWIADWRYRNLAQLGSVAVFLIAITTNVGGSGAIIGLATAILLALYRPGDGLGLLECRPMLFVGSISYSIYLWHVPVTMIFAAWSIGTLATNSFAWFAMVYVTTLVLSTLTYLLVERPTNRMGAQIARRWWPFAAERSVA